MTAFIIPMDLPGIEIRPIKQMSGGASFNEVFFNDVAGAGLRCGSAPSRGLEGGADDARLRARQVRPRRLGEGRRILSQLLATARPWASRRSARAPAAHAGLRARARRALSPTGGIGPAPVGPRGRPRGVAGKIMWTEGMRKMSDAVSAVPRAPACRPTPASGAPTPGPSTCSAPPLPHRRRVRRDPAQHHRRAGPRPPREPRWTRTRPGRTSPADPRSANVLHAHELAEERDRSQHRVGRGPVVDQHGDLIDPDRSEGIEAPS